jgi:hypothetical protein
MYAIEPDPTVVITTVEPGFILTTEPTTGGAHRNQPGERTVSTIKVPPHATLILPPHQCRYQRLQSGRSRIILHWD